MNRISLVAGAADSCGLRAVLATRLGRTHTARIAEAAAGFDPKSRSTDVDANLALRPN